MLFPVRLDPAPPKAAARALPFRDAETAYIVIKRYQDRVLASREAVNQPPSSRDATRHIYWPLRKRISTAGDPTPGTINLSIAAQGQRSTCCRIHRAEMCR